jgi:CubicO group peptidase (beta-lactamase class C family)
MRAVRNASCALSVATLILQHTDAQARAVDVADNTGVTAPKREDTPKKEPAAGRKAAHELDDYVRSVMAHWGIPGVAVAVVRDGEIVFEQGYGIREVGRAEQVDAHSIFGIGSMTKSFTALAAAMMVDEGKVDWDAPIIDYIPWFRFKDPWITAHATVRDLAAHRTGIDESFTWAHHTGGIDRTLKAVRYVDPTVPYGTFLYSNTGIAALGKVVEMTAHKSWDEVIKTRIFAPLDMTGSNTREDVYIEEASLALCWPCEAPKGAKLGQAALKPNVDAASPHGLTVTSPYKPGEGRKAAVWPWRYEPSIAPAGAVNSTVHDIANYLLFQLGDGTFKGKRILSFKQLNEMHTPQIVSPGRFGSGETDDYPGDGYALGWRKTVYHGYEVTLHAGGQAGFGSVMWMVPKARLGIVIMENMDFHQSHGHLAIARRFLDYYLGVEGPDWNAVAESAWSKETGGGIAPPTLTRMGASPWISPASAHVGTYASDIMGEAKVRMDDDGLVLEFEPTSRATLYHVANQNFVAEFRTPERLRLPLYFSYDSKGKAVGITFGSSARDATNTIRFRRVEE